MKIIFSTLLFVNLILYSTHVYQIFFDQQLTSIKPLYWYFLTVASAAFVFLFNIKQLAHKLPWNFVVWIAVYFVYVLVLFLYSSQSSHAIDEFIMVMQAIVILTSFLILMTVPEVKKISQYAMLFTAVLGMILNCLDFFTHIWSAVEGRGAGFYENPNIAGKILVFVMVASVATVPNKYRLMYCCLIGLGVLLAFSRGAWMLWAVAITGLSIIGVLNLPGRAVGVVLVGMFGLTFVFLASSGLLLEILDNFGLTQYLNTDTQERLGYKNRGFADHSLGSRISLISTALEAIGERPLFGAGLGFSREWGHLGTHNMYLHMAIEGGMLGLMVFIMLLLVLWYNANSTGRLLVILYSLSSLTTHNNLDQPATLVIIAMIAVTFKRESLVQANNSIRSETNYAR